MNKPKILKFSYEDYFKFGNLPLPMDLKLLQCFRCHHNDLSDEFIDYDTRHGNGNYKLPNTELIVLVLWVVPFLMITCRRYTPRKFDYYKSLEGETLKLVKA